MSSKRSKLKPDPRNARIHPERNRELIRRSLQEVGAGRSILVDGDGVIRAGNGVYQEAIALGLTVREVEAKPDELIAVKRRDLKGRKAERAALLDNRAAETSEWNGEVLRDLAATDGDLLAGVFTAEELASLVPAPVIDLAEPPESVEQNREELEAIKAQRKKGNAGIIDKTDTEKYLVIVFASREAKVELLKRLGLPEDERYIPAGAVDIKNKGIAKPIAAAGGRPATSAPPNKSGACG